MTHYKYIHLLWGNDIKFSGPLINMFISSSDVFPSTDHLFVTPYESVIHELPKASNIILDKGGTQSALINKYAKSCDWIISHGLPDVVNTLKIKRKYFKKIVWRTWGGSRQKTRWDSKTPLKSIIGKVGDIVYYLLMRYTFGCSPVIGIANVVDILDLEQWMWHRKAKLFPMGYSDKSFENVLQRIQVPPKSDTAPIKFLVGHQGDPGEKHFEYIQKLISYKEGNLEIYVPLSYGNKEYIEELEYAIGKLNDKRIIILDKLLQLPDYLNFLAGIDIAIIDEKSSMALGNIAFLLYFRKKIYLNKNGVIRKAFVRDNLPYRITDEIGENSYQDIISTIDYPENIASDLAPQPFYVKKEKYINLFSYLDNLNR